MCYIIEKTKILLGRRESYCGIRFCDRNCIYLVAFRTWTLSHHWCVNLCPQEAKSRRIVIYTCHETNISDNHPVVDVTLCDLIMTHSEYKCGFQYLNILRAELLKGVFRDN